MSNSASFTLPSKGRVLSPLGVLRRAPFFVPPMTLRYGMFVIRFGQVAVNNVLKNLLPSLSVKRIYSARSLWTR